MIVVRTCDEREEARESKGGMCSVNNERRREREEHLSRNWRAIITALALSNDDHDDGDDPQDI